MPPLGVAGRKDAADDKLGIASGLSSEGRARSHARRALEMGAAPDELRHVALLAFTTAGFPTMIAAMKWVEEVIGKYQQ